MTATEGPARVRFAPSPTGDLHIGGVRTALFNWLLARRTGGKFILRIEDTDQQRTVEGSLDTIYQSLRWLGLEWDEGPDVGGPHAPYVQSERLALYQAAAERLVEANFAYECDCTPERLARVRDRQKAAGQPTGYDGHCRERPREELEESKTAGKAVVVRARVPRTGSVTLQDEIREKVTFSYQTLSDFVILKSDGFPTYHLASVVDDHEMGITHVLRGDEWLASAPRHILLYEGLGYEAPVMAHLPIILAEDRTKLSKRHGATSALELRDAGYLPDALLNFLALLGWSPGEDREVMARDEIVEAFSLERVGAAAAIFDRKKLEWMNGVYIRKVPTDELAQAITPFLEDPERGLPAHVERPLDPALVRRLAPMVGERLKVLAEAPEMLALFFEDEISPAPEEIIPKKMDATGTAAALSVSLKVLRDFEPFDPVSLERRFRWQAEELGLKAGELFGSIRVAVTGRRVAPPLFDTIVELGREKCVRRLEAAIESLIASAAVSAE